MCMHSSMRECVDGLAWGPAVFYSMPEIVMMVHTAAPDPATCMQGLGYVFHMQEQSFACDLGHMLSLQHMRSKGNKLRLQRMPRDKWKRAADAPTAAAGWATAVSAGAFTSSASATARSCCCHRSPVAQTATSIHEPCCETICHK